KRRTNHYFKIKNIKNKNIYFLKLSILNNGRSDEYALFNMINNRHTNIIKTIYRYKCNFFSIIITPWFDKDLFSVIDDCDLTENQIKYIFKKIYSAILFLFTNGIIYTDLKAENILMTNNLEPYLIDMDLYMHNNSDINVIET